MQADQAAPATIDAYIASYPPDVQAILEQIRAISKSALSSARKRPTRRKR
jgi:hypothetical protein